LATARQVGLKDTKGGVRCARYDQSLTKLLAASSPQDLETHVAIDEFRRGMTQHRFHAPGTKRHSHHRPARLGPDKVVTLLGTMNNAPRPCAPIFRVGGPKGERPIVQRENEL